MSEHISIQQKIQQYRQLNPNLKDLSDEQILSIMSKNGEISLTKEQKISLYSSKTNTSNNHKGVEIEKQTDTKTIMLQSGEKIVISSGIPKYYSADGKELNQKDFEQHVGIIDVRNSGRYSITKNGKTRYYAFNGTELNEAYFKQVESNDVVIKSSDGKRYNFNKTLEKRINNVSTNLKKAEDENGFIGSTWSGFKNITGIGDSSDNVREQQEIEKKLLEQFNTTEQNRTNVFKELTGFDYTEENLEKFIKGEIKLKSEIALNGYKEGQAMAVDVGADIVSGVAAVGIYTAAVAAAPFTGGGSIFFGIASAGASGAAIKTGMKAADAATGGREYSLKDAAHDAATGTFSGVIAPVTGGLGGAVGKTVATKLGVQAVKQVGKEVAETAVESGVTQTIKTALTNPTGYEYVGGNIAKKSLALGAEMATDGVLGGSVDNAFRTAIDGGSIEDVAQAAGEGFVGGAILSPVVGGGMKILGKGSQKLLGKEQAFVNAQGQKENVITNMNQFTYRVNESFLQDQSVLRLANNLFKDEWSDMKFSNFKTDLREVTRKIRQFKELLVKLSDNGLPSKYICEYLRDFVHNDIKLQNIDEETMNSILRMQKTGSTSESLLGFIKLKLENQNVKSIDLLKNYNIRYQQYASKDLSKVSSSDMINDLCQLIKDAELDGHSFTKQDLKNCLENVNFKDYNLHGDAAFLLSVDEEMFKDLIKLTDTVQMNKGEEIEDYLLRINEIRKKSLEQKIKERLHKDKIDIENNYSEEVPLDEIILSPEEQLEYAQRKEFYISRAGDPSAKQGYQGFNRFSYTKENKYLSLALQSYERYNSTKYFASNPDKRLVQSTNCQYPPVIRFLDTKLSDYESIVSFLNGAFPEKDGSYQANSLKCCFSTPLGANENLIIPDVVVEIHPKAETSKAHLVGGWGNEVRYGGNSQFRVIDKFCDVQEYDSGCGVKRNVRGNVILQEL